MKLSHWELLLGIYQQQKGKLRMHESRANKNLMKTCYKNGWVIKHEDDTLEVTDKGLESAKEIAPLYERNTTHVGQTF